MYKAQIDDSVSSERENLILTHLPQVHLIASRIHERVPESVSLEDLVSAGIIGLICAIDNFDAGHNVLLKTYAEHKIRGAILDSLRKLDWASRDTRKKARRIEAAIYSAEQRLHREAAEEEIAAELKMPLAEYQKCLTEVRGVELDSLVQASAGGQEDVDLLEFISDDEAKRPSAVLERSELERLLAEALERMPKMERTVLSLYYLEELTLREVAQVMNLHPSRASQLKAQAVLRLRSYMEKRWSLQPGRKRQ